MLRWDGTATALRAPVRAFAFSLNEMEALGESPQNTGMALAGGSAVPAPQSHAIGHRHQLHMGDNGVRLPGGRLSRAILRLPHLAQNRV